jgi:hypothetical protein
MSNATRVRPLASSEGQAHDGQMLQIWRNKLYDQWVSTGHFILTRFAAAFAARVNAGCLPTRSSPFTTSVGTAFLGNPGTQHGNAGLESNHPLGQGQSASAQVFKRNLDSGRRCAMFLNATCQ